jgi:hypothetical protein
MQSGKLTITEYGPHEDPLGYIQPEDLSWILYWWQDGHATLYTKRSKSGAIEGDGLEIGEKKAA